MTRTEGSQAPTVTPDKYSRRVDVVEAVEFRPETKAEAEAVAEWCGGEFCYYVMEPGNKDCWFVTIPLGKSAHYGDFVVRNAEGAFTGCRAQQFQETYERSKA